MVYPVEARSERLRIREWRSDELEGMHRWLSDPLVNHFLSWGTRTRHGSERHLLDVLEAQREDPRQKYYLAIELLNAPGRTIGDTGFSWVDDGTAEIGYFLEPAYWGRGYATEASQIVIDLAFQLRARLVIATCDARNVASAAVMQRCAMTKQSTDNPARLLYAIERQR